MAKKRLQDITYEKVQARMRDHFMTATGKVIEGNYDIGDMAPVIFDRVSRRYLPVYKKKKGRRIKGVVADVIVSKRIIKACKIYLYNVPEEVVPMTNAGTITEDEVEGIDYFKTYYKVVINAHPECKKGETGKCLLDFNVCDTGEVEDCTPFYYDVPPGVPNKEGDIKQHCINSTSFCQGEIFEFAEDEEGTYFTWKAYTEYPPDKQNGLGYMLFKGFIPVEGKDPPEEVCASNLYIVKVNCCYKYSDAYKAFHPELKELELKYTTLQMDCGDQQTLSAEGGCLPFTWTLVSGGGILEPADDTVSAVYTAPDDNPSCLLNPTIKLEDRCKASQQVKLAVTKVHDYMAYMHWRWVSTPTEICLCGDMWNPTHVPLFNFRVDHLDVMCDGKMPDGWMPKWTEMNFDGSPASGPDDRKCVPYENLPYCDEPFPQMCSCRGMEMHNTGYMEHAPPYIAEPYIPQYAGWNGNTVDERTPTIIEQGCCPINPLTGLPY